VAAAAADADAAAVATAEVTERSGAPALVEARSQALLIAAVRGALALAGLGATIARGLHPGAAVALLAAGAVVLLFAVYSGDRRQRSALKFASPDPVPAGAHLESRARALAQAAYPSTIGLAVLTAVALWPQPGLAALLAGILAGLAVMSLIGAARLASWEHSRRARILIEHKTSRVFEAPQ
jgi:predicted permease